MNKYKITYGSEYLPFELPTGIRANIISPPATGGGLAEIEPAVYQAIKHPPDSPPLRELAGASSRVCIAVPDITRPCPTSALLPPVLAELASAGVKTENISILIAAGLHRPSRPEEKVAMLGAEIAGRYTITDHCATDDSRLKFLGHTSTGAPVVINRQAVEAGLLISLGVIEPHQYAGYSGGAKTVAIGLAGEETIGYTHSPRLLDLPGTRLGRLQNNPFQHILWEIAGLAGLKFILNIIVNPQYGIIALDAGCPKSTFERLAGRARQFYEAGIAHPYELVIGGVGHPKDANLYQLSRAASYLAWSAFPAVRKGGLIILAAKCGEGVGQGLGERRFYELMQQSPEAVIRQIRQHGGQAGEQRAYVMAQVLQYCRVMILGADCPEIMNKSGFLTADNMTQALRQAHDVLGHLPEEALVVPHALQTVVRSTI